MPRPFLLFLAVLTGWLTVPASSPAQEPTPPRIAPVLSSRTVGVGQQVVLSYQITGAERGVEGYPEIIEVPGLTITFSGQTQRFTEINGARQMEVSFRFTVRGDLPGEYQIPAQFFKLDGREESAAPITITVREGEPVDEDFLPNVQLTVGKTEFWKGEVVPVNVAILVHPAVQPLSQFFPQVKTPNFAVNRFDRSAGLEAREVNGEVWRAWQMESVMTALQSGAQVFGPAEIKAELLMPTAGGALNDPFLGRQQGSRRTLTLTSNNVSLNVKELPAEGRPADFSGAVGDFEIELQASPVSLNAGDPIAVEIGINGTGNFDAVTVPVMENTEGWRLYEPRISQENRGWGTEPGRKSFTQILIPEKNHTQIPPFVLHYFNPRTGAYVTRKSEPVLLTVIGEFKPASNAATDSKDFAAPVDASAPVEELGDILDQPLSGTPWMATAVAPIPVNRLLLHGVPALLMVLLIGQGLARRFRAAALARQPKPGSPREPFTVLADLRRTGRDRRTFYGLVNEYLVSVRHHQGRELAVDDGSKAITESRDRWLYGPDDAAAREAVPEAEHHRTLEILSRL